MLTSGLIIYYLLRNQQAIVNTQSLVQKSPDSPKQPNLNSGAAYRQNGDHSAMNLSQTAKIKQKQKSDNSSSLEIFTNSHFNLFSNLTNEEIKRHIGVAINSRVSSSLCHQNLVPTIREAIEKHLLAKEYIPQVIRHPGFKILCATRKYFHQLGIVPTDGAGVFMGRYFFEHNRMIIAFDISADVLSHEFWHARIGQLHRAKKCHISDINDVLLPYYPISNEQARKLEKALNNIIIEAKKYKSLCDRVNNVGRNSLTEPEKRAYTRYKNAEQHVGPISIWLD